MTEAHAVPAETDFPLVTGDPLNRLQRVLHLIPSRGLGTGRRILIAVALAWLPLVIWAAWKHLLLPGLTPEPLLRHFGIHTRFLLALPLLILSEAFVERSLRRIIPRFVTSGLVDEATKPAFLRALQRAVRMRDSRLALGAILGLVALATWTGWQQADHLHELAWAAQEAPGSFGALWYSYVSRPLFTLVLFAWLWRLVVVTSLFWQIARLDLRLAPTHPDRAGGLGFVERLPGSLAPFFFAISLVIAGHWGHQAMYHGLQVQSLQAPAVALIVVSILIGVAPLTAFVPRLAIFKRQSLAATSTLLGDYGRLFEQRWFERRQVKDGGLLEAPEIGPVADTLALYDAVNRMRPLPVSRVSLIPLAAATALPLIPVFAIQMPLKQVIGKLLGPLIGL
jgi:hypothetical protein